MQYKKLYCMFFMDISDLLHRTTRFELLKEIIALVIYKYESREILDIDLPYCFHAKLRIFEKLDILNRVLREDSGRTTDRSEIKTTVLLACIGYLL